MHGHLVTVKVGVERRADKGVQLNRLALNKNRFKRLNAEPVQRRRTIKHDGMFANDFFENIPDFRAFALDQALGSLYRRGFAAHLQLRENEWLEQFERHLLRQTALMQFQRGADHDDRTSRVIDTLAEEVLAEAALLALDHVGKRLQWTFVRARYRTAAAAIVEQCVDRFLQHAFFVAHNDIRRIQFEQATQTVVAINHAAVEIVEIRGRETAAVQWYQRTQVRRQNRQYDQHHPFGLVARLDK